MFKSVFSFAFLIHVLCRASPKLSLISFASQLTQIGLLRVCFHFKQCVSGEGVEWEDEDEQLEVLCRTANNGKVVTASIKSPTSVLFLFIFYCCAFMIFARYENRVLPALCPKM